MTNLDSLLKRRDITLSTKPPSPPVFDLSQHQGLYRCVGSLPRPSLAVANGLLGTAGSGLPAAVAPRPGTRAAGAQASVAAARGPSNCGAWA